MEARPNQDSQESAHAARNQLLEEKRSAKNKVGNQTEEFRILALAQIGKPLWVPVRKPYISGEDGTIPGANS